MEPSPNPLAYLRPIGGKSTDTKEIKNANYPNPLAYLRPIGGKSTDTKEIKNANYVLWRRSDRFVCGRLTGSLTEGILERGVKNDIDMIALSFVRKGSDLVNVRKVLGPVHSKHIKLMSKEIGASGG